MSDRLGTARWATDAEIYPYRYNQDREGGDADLWLGIRLFSVKHGFMDTRQEMIDVAARTKQHSLLCMGPRGGKGTSVIIPNLIYYRGSVVVIDPKGENATVTAARRGKGSVHSKGMGQKVYVLDPFEVAKVDPALRAGFNPLEAFDPSSPEAIDMVARVADSLVVAEDGDAHWNESARSLVQGLILHVLSWPDFEGERNLVSVFKLLNNGDWISIEHVRTENTRRQAAGEAAIELPDAFMMLWSALQENPAFDGLVAGAGTSLLATPEKERGSILSTARRHLDFIKSPMMQASLKRSDFNVSELKTDPNGVSIYLSLPTRYMTSHYRWLRMLVTLTLDEMERIAHQPKVGYPVLVILDEFAGLKRMHRIEDATAQIPGFGVRLMFVVQSLVQLREVYKENWETFLTSSGVRVFAANEDPFTLSYITKRMGEFELRTTTTSTSSSSGSGSSFVGNSWNTINSSSNSGNSSSTSEQLHKRPLMTEDEIAHRFSATTAENLVLASGMHPFTTLRSHYYRLPRFKGYYDPHPDHAENGLQAAVEDIPIPQPLNMGDRSSASGAVGFLRSPGGALKLLLWSVLPAVAVSLIQSRALETLPKIPQWITIFGPLILGYVFVDQMLTRRVRAPRSLQYAGIGIFGLTWLLITLWGGR